MTPRSRLLDVAIKYHDALPNRVRQYLNDRGIPDHIIDAHLLGWNGWRITVPVPDRKGRIVFFKLAKDPDDQGLGPKMLTSPGGTVELYGWEHLVALPERVIVCEGEFDRLVLEAQGFPAITSTAGAACFRPEWAAGLKSIREVYVCFDRDQAGRNGAGVVRVMVPHAKFVELPVEVGEGGDVTDFFARLGRSSEEFERLLEGATQVPPGTLWTQSRSESADATAVSDTPGLRIERIKRDLPIEKLIERYVELEPSPIRDIFVGRCPFHNDHTPSFIVFPRSRGYYCFGCRTRGDVIAFLAATEHISFNQALEKLERMITPNGETSEPNQNN